MGTVEDLLGGGLVESNGDGVEGLLGGARCGPRAEEATLGGIKVMAGAERFAEGGKEGGCFRAKATEHFMSKEDDPGPGPGMGRVFGGDLGPDSGGGGGKGGILGMGCDEGEAVAGEDGREDFDLEEGIAEGAAGGVGMVKGDIGVLGVRAGVKVEEAKVGGTVEGTNGKGAPTRGGDVVAGGVFGEAVLGGVPEGVDVEGAGAVRDGMEGGEAGEPETEAALGGDQKGVTGDAILGRGGHCVPEVVGVG